MPLALQTAPTVEPLAVVDAIRFWGAEGCDDNDRIETCLKAGRIWVEHFLGRAIVNRTYALYLPT